MHSPFSISLFAHIQISHLASSLRIGIETTEHHLLYTCNSLPHPLCMSCFHLPAYPLDIVGCSISSYYFQPAPRPLPKKKETKTEEITFMNAQRREKMPHH